MRHPRHIGGTLQTITKYHYFKYTLQRTDSILLCEVVDERVVVPLNSFKFLISISFSGFDCGKVSCTDDCPLDFKRYKPSPEVFIHLKNSTFSELHGSHSRITSNNPHLLTCCNMKCMEFCVTSENEIIPDGHKWTNVDDPCTTHICHHGFISNLTSVCSGLPCSPEYRFTSPGECCATCSSNWASFCPEDENCDIVCEFGFAVDSHHACDLCRCAKRKTETPTSPTNESSTSNNDAPVRSVHFYFYIDPTDGATRNLLIGFTVALGVIFVACLVGIGWYFHRRVYRQVPLLSLRNSSA